MAEHTHIFTWIWNVEITHGKHGTSCRFKELDLEWRPESKWSAFDIIYDGQRLRSYRFWRFQLGWGGFCEWLSDDRPGAIKKPGMSFFDNPTTTGGSHAA